MLGNQKSRSKKAQAISDSSIFKMHVFVSIVDRLADLQLGKLNLTYSNLILLFALEQHGQVKQKDLADCLGVTQASVSKQVEVLLQKGYVNRIENPSSRRSNQVALTAAGLDIFDQANDLLLVLAEHALSSLTSSERELLQLSLDKLINNVKNLQKK